MHKLLCVFCVSSFILAQNPVNEEEAPNAFKALLKL